MTAAPLLTADFVVARRNFEVAAMLTLAAGERLSLFGASGAGKTTCIEAIAGTVPLQTGRIELDGRVVNAAPAHRSGSSRRPVEPRARGVAMVRQPTTLFPHLDVASNVAYGQGARTGAAEELLGRVGLEGLGKAMPESLSGGQRQRACIARAIARPFRALLLDEPFSALDAPSRAMLRQIASQATTAAGAVAVLATHDLAEAQVFGDYLAIVDDGHLLQVGPSGEVVRQPATVRVAELCGYRSFLPHSSGRFFALHPDRFVVGALPDRGVVLTGTARAVLPFGPRYACELVLPGVSPPEAAMVVVVHVDAPPPIGEPWEVTALGPPLVATTAGGGR